MFAVNMNDVRGPAGLGRAVRAVRAAGVTLALAGLALPAAADGRMEKPPAFATPARYREMVSVPAMTVVGRAEYLPDDADGVFPEGRTVSMRSYAIARYETTYELWHEVRTWAAARGFVFANDGAEGSNGEDGAAPTAARTEPVTQVSWIDAVVWCNAYSVMTGRPPVYYADPACTEVITSLTEDRAYMKPGAAGYRLPTETEWEAAARGGDPADLVRWNLPYAGSAVIGEVAVYEAEATAPVGTRAANGLGLYDMTGNAAEWCFDRYDDEIPGGPVTDPASVVESEFRVFRGGAWNALEVYCDVPYRYYDYPDSRNDLTGFRVAAWESP